MTRKTRGVLLATVLLAAVPQASWSKVAFTGYGSVNFTPYSDFQIKGPAAFLAPAGFASGAHILGTGFSYDAVGLFATTKVDEQTTFSADITYKNIGNAPAQTRIQYAYLERKLPWDATLQAGRFLLPFGYYNRNRFYPFQRIQLSPPLFNSSILGLPMADTGAMLGKVFELGAVNLRAEVYGVNGYGSQVQYTSSGVFRGAGLPSPNISVANNLGTANNNRDVALGGQLALLRPGHAGELGASYYRGYWDRDDKSLLQLANAHLFAEPFGTQFLAEVIHMDVQDDGGMIPVFGSGDWTADGGFAKLDVPAGSIDGSKIWVYGRVENYWNQALHGGGSKETIRGAAGGLTLKQSDNLMWKLEYYWIDYRLPSTTATSLQIDGWRTQLGMVVTF